MQTINITPAMRRMYEKLSVANIKFLETINQNPEFLERKNYRELVGWRHPSSHVKLQPWPVFINQSTRREFAEASSKILDLVKSLPWRIFDFNPQRISEYFHLPLEHVRYFLFGTSREHIEGLLGRGDFMLASSGLKCIEFNATSTLGGWQLPIWESLYRQNPLISGFLNTQGLKITNQNLIGLLFNHLINLTYRLYPDEEEINLAVAIYDPVFVEALSTHDQYLNHLYMLFMRQLKQQSQDMPKRGKIILCMLNQLKRVDDHLYYEDKKIHTIIDYAAGDIPLDILALAKMGKVLLYNGPVSFIVSDKLNLALLSELEESAIFTDDERQTIKKHIPWTRKMTPGQTTYHGEKIELEGFVRGNQEQLVLKPAGGHGGEGVLIGNHIPGDQWQKTVTEAIHQRRWLVQERIDSLPFLFQEGENNYAEFDTVLGMFVYGPTYGGAWVRIMPQKQSKGVINTQQGAETPIVFEVED